MSSDPAPNPASSSKHTEALPPSADRESNPAPTPKGTDTGSKLAYHPLSLIILTIWVAYIAVLIWLLEHSTRLAKRIPQPAWNNRLTSAALTGFAQFHTVVTMMHLARLTIHAIHLDGASPPHLTEVYWLHSRKWGGPLSAGLTLFKRLRLMPGHRFSTTFGLFATTCLMTIPAPYLLERGYEERSLDATGQTTAFADTFAPAALPDFSTWMQMRAGEAAWVKGLPITDIYNSTLFVEGTQTRDDTAHDVVLAGSLAGWSAPALPGVRVQSNCDLYNDTIPGSADNFYGWCMERLPNKKYSQKCNITSENNSVKIKIAWCTDYDNTNTKWMSTSDTSPVTAYFRFNATNSAQSGNVTGMIKCTSNFSLGTFDADGRYNNFSSFVPSSNDTDTQLQHPLFAALYDLTMPFTVLDNGSSEVSDNKAYTLPDNKARSNGAGVTRVSSLLKMLGYIPAATSGEYVQPSLGTIADQLRLGTMCMGAAIGELAKRPNQPVNNATEYLAATGRVRDPPYIWAAIGLLIAWLLMMVFCTIRMFRRAVSAGLDMYIEKAIAANRRELQSGGEELADRYLRDDE